MLEFPTSMGRYFEWEDRGMIGALREPIEHGWLQLFCVDSVDEESWYARHKHSGDRAWRHMQYEQYLLTEVLPFTQHRNPDPYLGIGDPNAIFGSAAPRAHRKGRAKRLRSGHRIASTATRLGWR